MSEVFVYDDALSPVNLSVIDIEERDSRGVLVQLQSSTAKPGGLYGATMKLPAPMRPVGFWVDDRSGTYAPTGLEFLNPGHALRLDVTLFPLPSIVISGSSGGGGGGGHGSPIPSSPNDPTAQSAGWTPEENEGVAKLLATVMMARRIPEPDDVFKTRIERWEGWIEKLGIDVPRARGGQGSGGPSTVPFNPVIHIPGAYMGQGNVYRIPMEER